MTKTRTDVHTPSNIIPDDYRWIGQEYFGTDLGAAIMAAEERKRIRAHMEATGGTYSHHAHGGNCMVCGNAQALYTVIFHHVPTNTYVRMGQNCAMKCDMGDDRRFKAFRKHVKEALANQAGKAKAHAELELRGLGSAWTINVAEWVNNLPGNDARSKIIDIVGKLVKYGSLSDKQYEFLGKLVDQVANAADLAMARAAERASALPCPTGRVDMALEVVSVKVQEFDGYPTGRIVMTCKHADGWLVWGTVPSAIAGTVQRGETIHVRATVTPSDKDPKFGFMKRPMIINAEHAA